MNHWVMKSTDFWVIFNTNLNEASNMFETISLPTFCKVGLYVVISILLLTLSLIYSNNLPKFHWIDILLVLIFVFISLSSPFRSHVIGIDFYKSFYNFQKDQRNVAEFFKSRKDIVLKTSHKNKDIPKNYIVVIGESANRNHLGIYNYIRNTTPGLDSISSELVVYNNVVSPAVQTLQCLQQILTFSNYESPDMYKKDANIIELLKSCGYKTYWVDNQGVGSIDTYVPSSYRVMASMCDSVIINDNGFYDEIVINQVQGCLSDTAMSKAIFVHLIGSHFSYNTRYPENFKRFTDSIGIRNKFTKALSQKEISNLNDYDNSIYYTDYVLSSLINLLKSYNCISSLLYFSDHGEEVYDSWHYAGRSFEKLSRGMCEVPFVLWRNDSYNQHNDLYIDDSASYSTDDAIHSMLDWYGITYSLYDSTRSIFRPELRVKERYVQGVNYNDLK